MGNGSALLHGEPKNESWNLEWACRRINNYKLIPNG